MDTQHLRYFIAVAETGSITRAAERCGVAQPSLSQQIRRLERDLGVELFDRVGRGVALTDAGKALLPRARRILGDLLELEQALPAEAAGGASTLHIGVIPTMAPYLLPPLVGALRRERPDLGVVIHEAFTERLLDLLADMRLDCAVMSTPVVHPQIEAQVVGREELVAVVPRGWPSIGTGRAGWKELRRESTIALDEIHCLGRQIAGFCATQGGTGPLVCPTSQLATVFELVALGLGVSIVPEMSAARVADPRIGFVRLEDPAPAREIAVAWRRDRSRPRLAQRLATLLAEHLESGVHRLNAALAP